MFKKAVLLSLLITLSGMSAYAGLLDDFREDIVKAKAYAVRLEEGSTFCVPFPKLSDSKDLQKILPEDLAWQVLDNFKIPPQNIRVSVLSQPYFKGEEKRIAFCPSPSFLFNNIEEISAGQYSKKVLSGLFHPTLKNNDVSEQGGWDKFWPVRLSHQSGEIVSPHQVDEFSLSYKRENGGINLTSPDKIAIKGLPLSKQGQTASLWSLTIDKETHQTEATFHLLVNDADHKILDEMCTNASSLKLKELPSYLEEKNFGWVPNNTHLQVLKRLFQN